MYLKAWWSVAVWFLLPAWLIKTFNLYVNATWGSYHLHTCTWRKIINSSLMWQLWEFMGIVGKRVVEERRALMRGALRGGAGRPGPARYRNDLMHKCNPRLWELTTTRTPPRHRLRAGIKAVHCWFVKICFCFICIIISDRWKKNASTKSNSNFRCAFIVFFLYRLIILNTISSVCLVILQVHVLCFCQQTYRHVTTLSIKRNMLGPIIIQHVNCIDLTSSRPYPLYPW